MNCQPNDLARVISNPETIRHHTADKIVRVARLEFSERGSPLWVLEKKLMARYGMVDAILDCALRPIRDPGDDAVDETLLRLPSPRQEVTA